MDVILLMMQIKLLAMQMGETLSIGNFVTKELFTSSKLMYYINQRVINIWYKYDFFLCNTP